jgi:hypothetical protein
VACPAGKTNGQGDPRDVASTCDEVPCPGGSTGTNVAAGDCSCDAGHSGSIAAATAPPYYVGGCGACLENYYAERHPYYAANPDGAKCKQVRVTRHNSCVYSIHAVLCVADVAALAS